MKPTYLLYIDILGFGELTKNDHSRARRLYHLLETQHVHNHHAFRAIVFSDTILIYNLEEPLTQSDHEYLVMFAIEFAQNLLYTTIGKDFYFRAVLVHEGFEHSRAEKVERVFGPALVKAYEAEKDIQCTGLFIDQHCQSFNKIFKVAPWNRDLYFVYLNQSLDELLLQEFDGLPFPAGLLFDMDAQWHLAKDVRMLKDVDRLMQKHPDPRVRAKHLATWNFYYRRYPALLHALKERNFDPRVISEGFDWSEANRRIQDDYRGYGVKVPSVRQLRAIVKKARAAGRERARRILEEFGKTSSSRPLGGVGGALAYLDVDARSALGRFLLSKEVKGIDGIRFSRTREGIMASFAGLTTRQERMINEPAEEAALDFLRQELEVDGYLKPYWD